MILLDKFLKKQGVTSYEELTKEEKDTYREWEQALSGRKLTDEDVKTFLENEFNNAIARLTEVDLPKETEIFRKMEVQMIRKLMTFLNAPIIEKKLLEKQIESQL